MSKNLNCKKKFHPTRHEQKIKIQKYKAAKEERKRRIKSLIVNRKKTELKRMRWMMEDFDE